MGPVVRNVSPIATFQPRDIAILRSSCRHVSRTPSLSEPARHLPDGRTVTPVRAWNQNASGPDVGEVRIMPGNCQAPSHRICPRGPDLRPDRITTLLVCLAR